MVSLQNGKQQDFFVQGQVGDMCYLGVMDGNGHSACIDYVRTLDFDFIASQPDPAQTLWDMVQTGGNFYKSGCTFTFARITHLIEVWNVGDSVTHVYVNDQVFISDVHTFLNPAEVDRLKRQKIVYEAKRSSTFRVASDSHLQDVPSILGSFSPFIYSMVPSQCYGHNGCTGFAPHKQVIHYKSTDRVRIVCVSDGVTDMNIDLAEGTAEHIAKEAERRWSKKWMYHGQENQIKDMDDITCVVWERLDSGKTVPEAVWENLMGGNAAAVPVAPRPAYQPREVRPSPHDAQLHSPAPPNRPKASQQRGSCNSNRALRHGARGPRKQSQLGCRAGRAGGPAVCKFFNTPLGCARGEACKFLHTLHDNLWLCSDGGEWEGCHWDGGYWDGGYWDYDHWEGGCGFWTCGGREIAPAHCLYYNFPGGCVRGIERTFPHSRPKVMCDGGEGSGGGGGGGA